MQCDPSMRRISRSTSGVIALISLGIQVSILSEEPARRPANSVATPELTLRSVLMAGLGSASCQPEPIAHGGNKSESVAMMQHLVRRLPFTDQRERSCHNAPL